MNNARNIKNLTEKKLTGKTVIVTRAREQADELCHLLEKHGAKVIHIPCIRIDPPESWQACDEAIHRLESYHWLIFTSTNGVNKFLERVKALGKDIQNLQTKNIAVVGAKTAEVLQSWQLPVTLVPEQFQSEGLINEFARLNMKNVRVLIPSAQEGRALLKEALKKQGAMVDVVPVYKTVAPDEKELSICLDELNGNVPDVITFTSPSTVKNFVALIDLRKIKAWLGQGCRLAAIGSVTAQALEKLQLPVHIIPDRSTSMELVNSIVENFT